MVVPDKTSEKGKKEQVGEMFDNISPKYDLLNRTLSLGIDIGWRKKVINELQKRNPSNILDIATGTADLAIAESEIKSATSIIGVDISEGMMVVGREKIKKKNLQSLISLVFGDSENLDIQTSSYDAITCSFGVRNFENLEKGLKEIHRVLKPKGVFITLELSKPDYFPFKQFYELYFHNILPIIGKMVSKSDVAYLYLPNSVSSFPYGKRFIEILQKVGFVNCKLKKLTFGVCTMYIAEKD